MEIDSFLWVVVIGSVLDTLIGDPQWMPHPIRLFGGMIAWFESRLNRGTARRAKGVLMWVLLSSVVYLFFKGVELLLVDYTVAYIAWGSIFFFYGVSNRSLIEAGMNIEKIVQSGDLVEARKELSMIVGRDTTHLDATQIRRAVIETMSENLSDGVVAPLLFFALGGVPMMMLYKMINTFDSMVGYKSDRFRDFGFFSAKMDDVANFIPARLTALMMVVVSLSLRAIHHIWHFASAHISPNSGYPESAISGILDCRLGGANYYFGGVVEKPFIGDNPREITHNDLVRCAHINGRVAALSIIILILLGLYVY
ncbi:MAG: adenosylcobinamide-phosphate synthase CbiB [Rikenellaceae bacterium]